MDTKTRDELFTNLTKEITPLIEDGKIDSNALDVVLNKVKENDTKPEVDTKTAAELERFNKLQEDNLKQWTEQKATNDMLAKLGKTPVKKGLFLNALGENELNNISEPQHKEYGFGRYAQCLMNSYFAGKKGMQINEADRTFLNTVNSTLTDGAGAYTLQTEVLPTLFDDLAQVGYFFSETTPIGFQTGAGSTKKIPTVAAGSDPSASIAKVAEDGAKPIGNFTFTQIDLTLIKYAVIVPFTTEFQMYSPLDLGAAIKRFALDYFGIIFDDIFYNGDANIDGLADLSTTDATITGTQMSGLTVNDLLDVIGAMRSGDMVGAKWHYHPTMWAKLFQKENTAGIREFPLNDINGRTLLGFPVITSDYMQAFVSGASASTNFGYFGNMKKLFVGKYDGLDISFSDQASYVSGDDTIHMWQHNEVGYRLEMFVDMDCAFPSRIISITTAAA